MAPPYKHDNYSQASHIILQENQSLAIENDLIVTKTLNSNSLSVINGIAAKDITTTGLIQGYNLHASAAITGTTITASAEMNANSLSVTNGLAARDITTTGLIQGYNLHASAAITGTAITASDITANDLLIINGMINLNGTVNLNGTTGNSGDILTSNGTSNPTWNPPAIPPPYYIELDIGDYIGTAIYSATAGIDTTLNTLTTITTPISNYNSDLINSSTWSPSVAGLYSINYKAMLRSVNADYLVESTTGVYKEIGGVYTKININNVRNWGGSVNETDARVFTMTLPLTTTVYANIGDKFRFFFYGRSYYNNAIWLLTNPSTSNISITKLL